jgi:transcriptional regulator with XRE-family HTH domain
MASPERTDRTTFADWLAERLAERRDVTTMELAAEVGVLDGDVENWLAGRATPNEDECRRIANFLDVPPDEVCRYAGA